MQMTDFSERDICSKWITPAILSRGWEQGFVREEVRLTDGRVIVRGKVARRILNRKSLHGPRRADYVLYAFPHVALASVEAKRDIFPLGHGLRKALVNAEMLDAPFAISCEALEIAEAKSRARCAFALHWYVFPKFDQAFGRYQKRVDFVKLLQPVSRFLLKSPKA